MPFVEHRQRLYPLSEGENILGDGPECHVRIPGLSAEDRVTIAVEAPGAFIWTSNGGAAAAVNGRAIGRDPMPLFNGDQLTVRGDTLHFVDQVGERGKPVAMPAPGPGAEDPASPPLAVTERVAAPAPPAAPAAEPGAGGPATGADAPDPEAPVQRLVGVLRRLDDDQRYVLSREGFRIGREKRCDAVLPDPSVSRLHAEITFHRGRYRLRDHSRNGIKVNGERIEDGYELQIGDVLEVGKYEFTFSRRPATAEELSRIDEVTPIRGAVADAPTVPARSSASGGGGGVLKWLLILALAGTIAALLLAA